MTDLRVQKNNNKDMPTKIVISVKNLNTELNRTPGWLHH